MPLTLGTNISSLRTQRSLNQSSSELARVYERLSSGQRINRASDDAAGLAIADSLRVNQRIQMQAIRNLNDGISVMNIADAAIAQLADVTIRIRELAEQAANGTFGSSQRRSLDAEAQALSKEFTRIIQTTNFNGISLLSGGLSQLGLQAGYGSESVLNATVGGAIGDGTFGSAVTYAAESTSTTQVKLGDLNGDGLLDLVSVGTSGASSFATVRLGTGDGSFGGATSYALNASASLRLADANNDGILDIVAAGGGQVEIRLGTGSGTFGGSVSYAMSTSVLDVEVGDVNGDGLADLISAGTNGGSTQTISVRLGAGSGAFGAVSNSSFGIGAPYAKLSAGDMNNDGLVDIVVTPSGGTALMLLSNGSGTFRVGATLGSLSPGYGVATGDLNNDGLLDVTISSWAGVSQVYTFLQNGDGSFRALNGFSEAGTSGFGESRFDDINGDGNLDLLVSGTKSGAGYLYTFIGNGNGSFIAPTNYNLSLTSSSSLAFGDLNGDGVTDIVAGGVGGAAGRVSVLMGDTVAGTAPIQQFSLKTIAAAGQAMGMLDATVSRLSAQRGTIGSWQSRIEVGISTLQSRMESTAAAESRIRDADIASSAAELMRIQIKQQAGAAVLSQANLIPNLVLRLLGSG